MSDQETQLPVIDGVRSQDPERWRQFDAIYRPILAAYLSKKGLDESEANDVIQDIYVKLLGKIQTYDRSKCRFRSWLFTVAQNTLIDHARRRASRKKALDGWAAQVLQATPSDSAAMEEVWRWIHREKILRHALKVVRARVSPKAWTCFEQRLLRNRPAAEIAAEIGIEPNSVYVHACRVMKKGHRASATNSTRTSAMPSSLTCPEDPELLAVAAGEEPADELREHVDGCRECQTRLGRCKAEVVELRGWCSSSPSRRPNLGYVTRSSRKGRSPRD